MGLVHELQQLASGDEPCLTVLRKAKLVASKLGRNDISAWLDSELNGYPGVVPDYRIVAGHVAYHTATGIPIGFGRIITGTVKFPNYTVQIPLGYSIGDLDACSSGPDSEIALSLPEDMVGMLREQYRDWPFRDRVTYCVLVSKTSLASINQHVKNRILDWSCKLEQAGVTGDNFTFDRAEQQRAGSITFNINGCTVEQISASGRNSKG